LQPSLADLQQRIRDAVVFGDATSAAPLVAGAAGARRLAIHGRHYATSLVAALMKRFPATGWLAGTPMVEAAARRFVRDHPPSSPCIAEYGLGFPRFLSTWPGAEGLPYLLAFAEFDWHLGRLAVSVDLPAVTRTLCAALPPWDLADATVRIQPGAHYLDSAWPLDELMTLYLTDSAPDMMVLAESDVWIEARGSRGALRLSRLTPAEFSFRLALSRGHTIGEAAPRAWQADEAFDPGLALLALVDAGLAISIDPRSLGERP
jgi:hypothetical protein